MVDARHWSEVLAAAAELGAAVQARFEAHPHHVMATLHRDGRPRVSGSNIMFDQGRLWFGSTPGSVKAADLLADPRCAIHSAPLDEELPEGGGDARVEGVAVRLTDDVAVALLDESFGEDASIEGDLWELQVTSMSLVTVEGEEMRVRSWSSAAAPADRRSG